MPDLKAVSGALHRGRPSEVMTAAARTTKMSLHAGMVTKSTCLPLCASWAG